MTVAPAAAAVNREGTAPGQKKDEICIRALPKKSGGERGRVKSSEPLKANSFYEIRV